MTENRIIVDLNAKEEQKYAVRALTFLAGCSSLKLLIAAADGITPLVGLLRADSAELFAVAAKALGNITQHPQNKYAMAGAGCISALHELLSHRLLPSKINASCLHQCDAGARASTLACHSSTLTFSASSHTAAR